MKQAKAKIPNRTVDAKASVLGQHGALHPHPEQVRDELFERNEFFDPRDLVQVRYEMLRRRQVDGQPVTDVATAFGVSRQAFYVTETAFAQKGIAGLLPRPRGPRRAHKCTEEILDFVEQWATNSPAGADISEAVQKRFGVAIHPRSLVRALGRRKKKQL
jgi:transposase